MRHYFNAMRPHQWIKNVLVFVPALAAHRFDPATWTQSLTAFAAFCCVASSVYLLNDMLDLTADRAHPRKRHRPLASGAISLASARLMAAVLLILGIAGAALLELRFAVVLMAYFAITTAYSLGLKRLVVLDVGILAGLYTARIFAGSVATDIPLSLWLLAFSLFLFFSLAAVKRQAELVDCRQRGDTAAAGRGYQVDDLPVVAMMAITSGYIAALVLALYVNSPAVLELYARPTALWGICCVLLYWITRMVLIAHRGRMHDDPAVFATTDRGSLICIGLSIVFAIAGMSW